MQTSMQTLKTKVGNDCLDAACFVQLMVPENQTVGFKQAIVSRSKKGVRALSSDLISQCTISTVPPTADDTFHFVHLPNV